MAIPRLTTRPATTSTLKEIASTEAVGVPNSTLRKLLAPIAVGRWRAAGARHEEVLYDTAGVRERVARHRKRGTATRPRRRRRKERRGDVVAEYGLPPGWVRLSEVARERGETTTALRGRLTRIDAAWSKWRSTLSTATLELVAELAQAMALPHAVLPVTPRLRVVDGRCSYAVDARAIRFALAAPTPDGFEASFAAAFASRVRPSDCDAREGTELDAAVRDAVLSVLDDARRRRFDGDIAERLLGRTTKLAMEARLRRANEEKLIHDLRCIVSTAESLVPARGVDDVVSRVLAPHADARLPAMVILAVAGLPFDRESPHVEALSRCAPTSRRGLLRTARNVVESWERADFERRRAELREAVARAR